MSIDVRIPTREGPSPVGVAVLALLGLAAGVGLAAWARGTEDELAETTGEQPGPASAEPTTSSEEEPPAAQSPLPSDGTVPREVVGASDAGPPVGGPDAPADEAPPGEAAEVPLPATGEPAPETPAPSGLVVRRGRIAYLRCDGIALRRGPFPCPRDEALEAAIGSVIDGLLACPAGPRAAGEGDLRIELTRDGPPDVGWRDTFSSATVRLDSESVLACVRGPLAAARQSLGAERLLVSFRFAIVPSPE